MFTRTRVIAVVLILALCTVVGILVATMTGRPINAVLMILVGALVDAIVLGIGSGGKRRAPTNDT